MTMMLGCLFEFVSCDCSAVVASRTAVKPTDLTSFFVIIFVLISRKVRDRVSDALKVIEIHLICICAVFREPARFHQVLGSAKDRRKTVVRGHIDFEQVRSRFRIHINNRRDSDSYFGPEIVAGVE